MCFPTESCHRLRLSQSSWRKYILGRSCKMTLAECWSGSGAYILDAVKANLAPKLRSFRFDRHYNIGEFPGRSWPLTQYSMRIYTLAPFASPPTPLLPSPRHGPSGQPPSSHARSSSTDPYVPRVRVIIYPFVPALSSPLSRVVTHRTLSCLAEGSGCRPAVRRNALTNLTLDGRRAQSLRKRGRDGSVYAFFDVVPR